MGKKKTDTAAAEPLLAGTLNERFCRAVHGGPALFHDVVQTGRANGEPYEIVLLHGGNVDDRLLGQMMALQDKIAKVKAPDPANAIDYKSEEEIIGHYGGGGLGLGVFTAGGKLIGQTMLSFRQPVTGPFAAQGEESQANIDWLMVERAYGGNGLCDKLIFLAVQMAESSGMSQVRAHVRVHNEKAIARFAASGFVIGGTGENEKDGSAHLRAFRPVAPGAGIVPDSVAAPISFAGLRESGNFSAFARLVASGHAARWDRQEKRFTFHRLAATLSPL